MLKREKYLSIIREFYDINLIKVIIGIRKCGKSVLIKQIIDELLEKGVDKEHIIYLNFEDLENMYLKNYLDLNNFIKGKVKDNNKYYLFLDQVELIDKWEKAICSFMVNFNISIFLTGTNCNLLASNLENLLSGKYVTFKIMPFTFNEVVQLKKIKDKIDIEDAFNEYLKWGGMPQRFEFKSTEAMKIYLKEIYDAIVLKDIIRNHKIKNISLFQKIMEYLVSNPSQEFSPSTLLGEFEKEEVSISTKTIYECLDYAKMALLMSKASTFDVRGKRILSRKDKYYLADLGLGQIIKINENTQFSSALENIVYNELVSRNYNVTLGSNKGKQISFIATKDNDKEYYQVVYDLSNKEIEEKIFKAYDNINDNYPKYVLSINKLDYSQNGIIHKNVIDWLLKK